MKNFLKNLFKTRLFYSSLFFFYFFLDDCTITRSSFLIETYFYHIPYVGIGLFFSTWLVALFFVLALIYSLCRKSRTGTFNEFDSLEFEEDSQ